VFVCLSGALAYWMVKTLTGRGGRLATVGRFALAYFVLSGLLMVLLTGLGISEKLDENSSMLGASTFIIYILGGLILGFIALIRFRDIRLWFPAKAEKNK
jgi:FtsH-binding integral membrane protein